MTTQIDEETPLLQENNRKKRPTPLPWSQFSLVLVLQLTEPLSLQVIYPFAPQVGITMRILIVYLIVEFQAHPRCGHNERG